MIAATPLKDLLGSGFNGNISNCLKILAEEQNAYKVAIISVSSSASVACVLAITFIVAFKGYKKFVHRLTLYLIIAALLELLVSIVDVLPVYHDETVVAVRRGYEGLCAVVGFLIEVTLWMKMLVICWIVLYLVMVLVFRHNANTVKRKHEVCGIAVVLLLPPLVTWVPFVKERYGLSEVACWIKLSENSTCIYDYIGLTFMFAFYYGPAFCVGMVTLVALCTILIVICRRAMRQEQGFGRQSIYRQGIKEVLPLILYPLIYLLLLTTLIATRIHDAIASEQWTKLSWLVYHIIIISTRLFIPFICLLHLSTICCRKKQIRQRVLNTTTSFTVSNECTDQENEPLVINQGTKTPSKTYQSIFEGNSNVSA